MGKLDLNSSDFKDEKVEDLAPAPCVAPHPVSPLVSLDMTPTQPGIPMPATGGLGPALILSLVEGALGTITEISRCAAAVSIEKQRTKQIQAQTDVQIEVSRQQTEQVRIQQKEETRRFEIQCKNELKSRELELKELRAKLQLQNDQRRDLHRTYMASLNTLEKAVAALISQSNALCGCLKESTGGDTQLVLLQNIDAVNTKLVELSKEIVRLRQG